DPGLQNWTVFLDTNNNGTLDTGEPSTTTDANGNYTFSGLGQGTYRVREVLQSGWSQTTANPADIVAQSGVNVSGRDFGNSSASASAARCLTTSTSTPPSTPTTRDYKAGRSSWTPTTTARSTPASPAPLPTPT